MLTTQELEQSMMNLVTSQRVEGVILLLIHPGQRAEVISAFDGEYEHDMPDLAAKIHRMADEIGGGAGMPIGGDPRSRQAT